MASIAAQKAAHATLVANTQDDVTLSGVGMTITIANYGATTDIISYRIGTVAGNITSPTAPPASDDYKIVGGQVHTLSVPNIGVVIVKLKSAQAPAYSVQAIPHDPRN